jgi:hypothetical protein
MGLRNGGCGDDSDGKHVVCVCMGGGERVA